MYPGASAYPSDRMSQQQCFLSARRAYAKLLLDKAQRGRQFDIQLEDISYQQLTATGEASSLINARPGDFQRFLRIFQLDTCEHSKVKKIVVSVANQDPIITSVAHLHSYLHSTWSTN